MNPPSAVPLSFWSGPRGFVAALAAALLLLAVHQLVTPGGANQLAYAVNDALHVPLFALLTLLLARLLGYPGALALVAAGCVVAILSEGLQLLTGRDASLVDLGHDLAGVIPVALGLAIDARLRRCGTGRARLLLWLGVALLLAVLAAAAPVRIWLAYQERAARFPVLVAPDMRFPRLLIATRGGLRTTTAPAAWTEFAGQPVLEVTWASGEPYPGIVLLDVPQGWAAYQSLEVALFVPDGLPFTLTASLWFATEPSSAAWSWQQAGAGRVSYALDRLLAGHAGDPVGQLVLHASERDAGRQLLIGRVALTGTPASGP